MKHNKFKKKTMVVLLLLAALIVGVSIAYLKSKSGIENAFELGDIQTEISESFDGEVKKDVKVKNTGGGDAYIRCKISVYYEIQDGDATSISKNAPIQGVDYRLVLTNNFSDNWFRINDVYYYKKPVKSGEETAVLIDECKELKPKSKEKLVVDISAQAIQTNPEEAVTDAWKEVEVDSQTKELRAKEVQ